VRDSQKLGRDKYIQEVRNLYAQTFGYSRLPRLLTAKDRIAVVCPDHGEFEVNGAAHRRGSANCPDCKRSSRFERAIARVLTEAGVPFETQWSDSTLRYRARLRFDFMLPESKTLIEYDGAFHHRPIKMPGQSIGDAERAFRETQERDAMKTKWAEEHGWKLVRLALPHRIVEDIVRAGIISERGQEVAA
jgi:very-short-patch-repair endonuclease